MKSATSRTTNRVLRVVVLASLPIGLARSNGQLGAQTPADLKPDARVRVEAQGIATAGVVWRVSRVARDTLFVIGRDGGPLGLPLGALTKLEVSRGVSHVRGAMVGAAVGGAAGVLVGSLVAFMPAGFPVNSGNGGDPHAGKHFAQGFGATLAAGTLVGFALGSETWQRITLQPAIAATGRLSR